MKNVSETKERKVVGRRVALALGIICIILIALVAFFTVTGISAQNSYNNLQNQDKQLQTWLNGNETILNETQTWLNTNITAYETQIASLHAMITQLQTWLNSNVTAYQNEVSLYNNEVNQCDSLSSENINLNNIVNLSDSHVVEWDTTVEQGNEAYSYFYLSALSYAGYVSVHVRYSTVIDTWVSINYTAYGINYNQEITVSAGSSAVFPVLPSNNYTIGVGNDLVIGNGASETVDITYYY